LGRTIDGRVGRFTVTRAGLIAAGHRGGATATFHYLQQIAGNGFNSNGLALRPEALVIETRLRTFADAHYE
jgi:hypothetical protein